MLVSVLTYLFIMMERLILSYFEGKR